jgi:hypothetical protein
MRVKAQAMRLADTLLQPHVCKFAHASSEDVERASMTESVNAWQCIGCGRIEAPQTCVGICEYRKVQFVDAFDHERALATAAAARREADILGAVVRQLAHTSPRPGECERSYEAMQKLARRALLEIAAAAGAPVTAPSLVASTCK